jgi:class 3 adenylate cyclase
MRRADDYPAGIPNHIVDRFLETNTQPATGDTAEDFLSFAAPSVAGDPVFRSWWDRSGRRGASPATAKAVLEVLYRADVRPLLGLVRAPTLVLHRRDSRNHRVGHGRYLAAHIPGARLVELSGADCLYWVGDCDEMMDEVEEFLTGQRRGPNAERVLATVLFTDIVGSTDMVARVGERRWHELLDRHDDIARHHVARFRGRVVKTTGDGIVATFDGPARGVLCAAAIRDALLEHGIEIRAGLHIGEVEVRGDDIAGMTVHAAARIEALAGAGEILVSRTIVDLIVGSGIDVDDRGEHQLKGVPQPMTVFAVRDAPSRS